MVDRSVLAKRAYIDVGMSVRREPERVLAHQHAALAQSAYLHRTCLDHSHPVPLYPACRDFPERLATDNARVAIPPAAPRAVTATPAGASNDRSESPAKSTRPGTRPETSPSRVGVRACAKVNLAFDLIVTAQQAGSYKPAPMHFLTAREQIGDHRWLHAAQSNFHDIVPTNALGIPNAWINRKSNRALPGGAPRMEFKDLQGLANALT